jgi:hypothetical protein
MIENTSYNYLMMPGDETAYRFGFQFYPLGKLSNGQYNAYILDSGVKGGEEYIQFWVNMPSGKQISCVSLYALENFGSKGLHLVDYLREHGMDQVHIYTLVAVLLALRHLIKDPKDKEVAAKAILETPAIISKYASEKDY